VKSFLIAPAQLKDSEELSCLVNSAYRGTSSYKGWTTEAEFLAGQRIDATSIKKMLEEVGTFILCLRSNKSASILGCVHLKLGINAPFSCYLGMLTISPREQTNGWGSILLEEAEKFARKKGARSISLNVIYLRESLIEWYERRGYRRTGKTQPFPYGDETVGIPLRQDLSFLVFEKAL
jgi:ribosomal protein S18 acetylase RimI-like enzyme